MLSQNQFSSQWMEKKQDGGFVFRSGRAEERETRRFDDDKNKSMEALYAKIQSDIETEDKGTVWLRWGLLEVSPECEFSRCYNCLTQRLGGFNMEGETCNSPCLAYSPGIAGTVLTVVALVGLWSDLLGVLRV